ncbi:MAG: hypothetical protein JSV76_01120 [Candidatus Bathyarchaeota archaeon]|nr:MAG: hypothetical protein JSV76_01120 [Candidatus Bathyarchaeota archaeon]
MDDALGILSVDRPERSILARTFNRRFLYITIMNFKSRHPLNNPPLPHHGSIPPVGSIER